MVEVIERSAADLDKTVANILADLRAHRIAGPVAAEIREAVEDEELEGESDKLPWVGVAILGLTLSVLLALWCRGIL